MELKNYQKDVIKDLKNYLSWMNQCGDIKEAYQKHWESKNVRVGIGGVPGYNNIITRTPHVCFKVPTGGGKTFLACNSIKQIFDALLFNKPKVVVWLVPSEAILEQTLKTLTNPEHPYRAKLDADFSSRVEVYDKLQVLNGQNFNPTSVGEQLSILILSYDSFRSKNKEGRKVYQENSNLEPFTQFINNKDSLINDVDESALINVINQLSPLVIVDESHHAISDLSVEMLNNLNPCFVLDLTATPKENSNIISYVDAFKLKNESMVKLPVIAYNRKDQADVIYDAITLRKTLELKAKFEEENSNIYIRPIVLFQAEPKGKEDSTTFEKLKEKLISLGIPKEQIAIKTATINEIKGIDILDRDCEIRYIITINALKEGWDCPFAYILATLANKTSKVDVEQILGRILRQPYTKKHIDELLNMSYVLTSSNDFKDTLEQIIKGLNNAGYSEKDFRIPNEEEYPELIRPKENIKNIQAVVETSIEGEEFLNFSETDINLNNIENSTTITDMISSAVTQNEIYEEQSNDDFELINLEIPMELKEYTNGFKMREKYEKEAIEIRVPQFFIEQKASLFTDDLILLSKGLLLYGFKLSDKDTQIDFDNLNDEAYKVDISDDLDSRPQYSKMSKKEINYLKQYFANIKSENKPKICVDLIYKELERMNDISASDLRNYILRIINDLSKEHIDNIVTSYPIYAKKIKDKIEMLKNSYQQKQFSLLLEQNKIIVQPNYRFPIIISPLKSVSIDCSLYIKEIGDMNNLEHEVITTVAALDNIEWWHRIIERGKNEFYINGPINHYPDFIVKTKRGTIIIIETKGEHLKNDNSLEKVELGRMWQNQIHSNYKYYMVFKDKSFDMNGAVIFDDFIEIIKEL